MRELEIKDSCGRIVGIIRMFDSGDKEARMISGKYVGRYRASYDDTQDANFVVVARGDVLCHLIMKEAGL